MCKYPKRDTLAHGLIETTTSMLDEIESKTVHKDEEGNRYISKNPQSFLEISPVQKEVLSSHELQDHAYES